MNMRKANTIKSTGYTLLALCFSHFYATGAMACAEQLGNQLGAKINELNAAEVNYLTGAAASSSAPSGEAARWARSSCPTRSR